MQWLTLLRNVGALATLLGFACAAHAQDTATEQQVNSGKKVSAEQDVQAAIDNGKAPKKMVGEATLNLQATITGNQEQPRVLYILPWQSPAPEDVDFTALDNQQKAAFVHIEREELRREMEAASE